MSKAEGVSYEDRAQVLEAKRLEKMASSPHAYVRGATADFYRWLSELNGLDIPSGPPIWICGDCHVGNLGPIADLKGRVDVQIRDLDQTTIGNPAHDLIRLGLSLASVARGSDLPGAATANMIEEMVAAYGEAMAQTTEADEAGDSDIVRSVRRRALGRRWRHLAKERLEDAKPTIPLGRKFWALADKEREALSALFADRGVREMVLALNASKDGDLKLLDAAYWVKGCSSLGKLRYAALLEIDQRGDGEARFALVDLKEAVASVAPSSDARASIGDVPRHHGQRVVAGARALSPNLGDRMMAADVLDRPIVVRELAPQDLKLEVDQFSSSEAGRAARHLAQVVGKAHARQMDDATRRSWCRDLQGRRPSNLEAPNWLWTSVVQLAARHEQGYLEHCRKYALRSAA